LRGTSPLLKAGYGKNDICQRPPFFMDEIQDTKSTVLHDHPLHDFYFCVQLLPAYRLDHGFSKLQAGKGVLSLKIRWHVSV
jgi:hypothetical protein